MGGVGSRVVFWTWPALEAASGCARVCVCALVLVPWVGAGEPLVAHRGQDAEVAVELSWVWLPARGCYVRVGVRGRVGSIVPPGPPTLRLRASA